MNIKNTKLFTIVIFVSVSLAAAKEFKPGFIDTIFNIADLNQNNKLLDSLKQLPNSEKIKIIKNEIQYAYDNSDWIIIGTVLDSSTRVNDSNNQQGWSCDKILVTRNLINKINSDTIYISGEYRDDRVQFKKQDKRAYLFYHGSLYLGKEYVLFLNKNKNLSRITKRNVFIVLKLFPRK